MGPLPEDDVSDDELIAAVLVGELAAIDVLYERHAHVVFALIVRILGDREEAEDLCKRSFSARGNRLEPSDESRGSGPVAGYTALLIIWPLAQLRHRRWRPQRLRERRAATAMVSTSTLGASTRDPIRRRTPGAQSETRDCSVLSINCHWAARGSCAVCGRVQPIRNRRQLE